MNWAKPRPSSPAEQRVAGTREPAKDSSQDSTPR